MNDLEYCLFELYDDDVEPMHMIDHNFKVLLRRMISLEEQVSELQKIVAEMKVKIFTKDYDAIHKDDNLHAGSYNTLEGYIDSNSEDIGDLYVRVRNLELGELAESELKSGPRKLW